MTEGYCIISEDGFYKGSNIKSTVYCTRGHKYKIAPRYFVNDEARCSICKGQDKIESFLLTTKRQEYKQLTEFTNSTTKIKIIHSVCGYQWKVLPGSFINGTGCPRCGGVERINTEDFKNRVYEEVGEEYSVLSEYKGTHSPIKMKHNKCGHTYKVKPSAFISTGRRCARCSNLYRRTHEEYVKEIERLGEGEYEVLSCFTRTTEYVKLKHKSCGYEWKVLAYSFLAGHRCPKCMIGKSQDSVKIGNLLSKKNVFFLNEYTIEKCRNIRPLPFDFAIIKGERIILIEYDGKQHFEPVEPWGGEETHQEIVLRDQIKNKYCIDNKIPLIRIPYWETDRIEYIINNVLAYFNLIEGDCEDKPIVEKYYVTNNWSYKEYYNSLNLIQV